MSSLYYLPLGEDDTSVVVFHWYSHLMESWFLYPNHYFGDNFLKNPNPPTKLILLKIDGEEDTFIIRHDKGNLIPKLFSMGAAAHCEIPSSNIVVLNESSFVMLKLLTNSGLGY